MHGHPPAETLLGTLSIVRTLPFRNLGIASVISNIWAQIQTVAAARLMTSLTTSRTQSRRGR